MGQQFGIDSFGCCYGNSGGIARDDEASPQEPGAIGDETLSFTSGISGGQKYTYFDGALAEKGPLMNANGRYSTPAMASTMSVNSEAEPAEDYDARAHWGSMFQEVGLKTKSLSDKFSLFDVNLLEDPERITNIGCYCKLCLRQELLVTLSCFSVWNKNKKTNGHAKLIPAVPTVGAPTDLLPGSQNSVVSMSSMTSMASIREEGPEIIPDIQPGAIRVFFFDDNMNFDEGGAESPGICNLRHVVSGDFIDFSEGKNGFRRAHEAQHTVVHYSTEFQVVLVQANILDAMEDKMYFNKILQKYSHPGEKLLVFMDVNSTIVCVDTVTDKSMAEILLSTMFEFIELRPSKGEPCEIVWDDMKAVKVPKNMTLKALVKKIAADDKEYYRTFYTLERCENFLGFVLQKGEVHWSSREDRTVDASSFMAMFEDYLNTVADGATETGIVKSWFTCYDFLSKARHSVVINSFGIDTRKVIGQTVSQEDVMHITVNHTLWDPKDQSKFEDEYGIKCRRKSVTDIETVQANQMRALVKRETLGMGSCRSGTNFSFGKTNSTNPATDTP